jgi:hypothetical protein
MVSTRSNFSRSSASASSRSARELAQPGLPLPPRGPARAPQRSGPPLSAAPDRGAPDLRLETASYLLIVVLGGRLLWTKGRGGSAPSSRLLARTLCTGVSTTNLEPSLSRGHLGVCRVAIIREQPIRQAPARDKADGAIADGRGWDSARALPSGCWGTASGASRAFTTATAICREGRRLGHRLADLVASIVMALGSDT